jgi:quinol monooxygenase YgiN
MISQIARVLKGQEIQACEAFKTMAEAVKANEPGCLMYPVTRGQVNAQEVYASEIYGDHAAFDAHRKTEHLQEFQQTRDQFLDRGSWNVEVPDEVAGFVRSAVEAMAGQM